MRAPLFLISLALSSAACSDVAQYSEKTGVDPAAVASASSDKAAAEPRAIEEETERYIFSYSWPAAVSSEQGLVAVLEADAEAVRKTLVADADRQFESFDLEEFTPRQISETKEWKVVADIPRFLSLSGHLASYSGGAHGMYGLQSMIWDREAARAMEGKALFASEMRLQTALDAKLCKKLNAVREARRGFAIDPSSTDTFDACPGLDEATVLVGSSNGRTFDRIAIYFGPYVAGPYAEGAYELDFPVDAAVIDAVKPEYASAFSIKR